MKREMDSWKKEVGSRKSEAGSRNNEPQIPGSDKMPTIQFKFEKLIIWQKAMEFGEEINRISYKFPKEEIYNLSSQIRRAGDSIALNISEGAIGQSNPEYKKFMGYAIRSLAEVVTCLHKASKRKYITEEDFYLLYVSAFNLMNMMVAFKGKIN